MTELSKNTEMQQSCETAVKCRFFVQYWGQNYNLDNGTIKWEVNHRAFPLDETATLLLKPLSKITGEDALNAIKIFKVYRKKDGVFITEHCPIENIKLVFLDIPIWRLDVADYLRSKGYALPFMEYSVDDLVSFGWVQLV